MSLRLILAAASIPALFLAGCGEPPARAPETSQTATAVPGVPGGTVTTTTVVTARVVFKDNAKRQVTLKNSDGKEQTFDVPKDAVNYDQVSPGDLVVITLVEQLAIAVFDASVKIEQGEAAVLARAEKGQKPAGAIVSVTQIRGKVTAIDLAKRTATVAIDNGPVRVVPVRDDIDLSKNKVGDQVVMRITLAMELRVEAKAQAQTK